MAKRICALCGIRIPSEVAAIKSSSTGKYYCAPAERLACEERQKKGEGV